MFEPERVWISKRESSSLVWGVVSWGLEIIGDYWRLLERLDYKFGRVGIDVVSSAREGDTR